MKSFFKPRQLQNQADVLDFFTEAVKYRNQHASESEAIALFVFDQSHPAATGFELDQKLEQIRFEFGALEALEIQPIIHKHPRNTKTPYGHGYRKLFLAKENRTVLRLVQV